MSHKPRKQEYSGSVSFGSGVGRAPKKKKKKRGATIRSKVTAVAFGGKTKDASASQIAEAKKTGKAYFKGGKKILPGQPIKPKTTTTAVKPTTTLKQRAIIAKEKFDIFTKERQEAVVDIGQLPTTAKQKLTIAKEKFDIFTKERQAGVSPAEQLKEFIASGELEMKIGLGMFSGGGLSIKLAKPVLKAINEIGKLTKIKGISSINQPNTKTAGLIKSMWNKIITSNRVVTSTNPATGKITTTVISETAATKPLIVLGVVIASLAWITEKALGGQNFGKFLGQEEAAQTAGMAAWIAQGADDYDGYWAASQLTKDALNEEISKVPFKNVADGLDSYRKTALAANLIVDQTMIFRQHAEEGTVPPNSFDPKTGEYTDANGNIFPMNFLEAPEGALIYSPPKDMEEYWENVNAKEQQQYLDNKELSSRMFREDTDYAIEAKAAAAASEREKDKKFYEEMGRFWANEADKEREKEAENRIAIAEFWVAYRKQIQKASDNNRPSNLNFGLL